MLRLDQVIKPWKESAGSERPHQPVRLLERDRLPYQKRRSGHGSARSPAWTTRVWTMREQEYAVKRLEAALKAFGPGFHVYQYLFKSNRPDIPFASYDDPVVEAAIDQRRKFFEAKRDHSFKSKSSTVVLLEGARSKDRRGRGSRPPCS